MYERWTADTRVIDDYVPTCAACAESPSATVFQYTFTEDPALVARSRERAAGELERVQRAVRPVRDAGRAGTERRCTESSVLKSKNSTRNHHSNNKHKPRAARAEARTQLSRQQQSTVNSQQSCQQPTRTSMHMHDT